ncbi:FHA domain-containing protein [Christensenellaceae bacterium OttesenSCG-928-M15]|nr:FHA domain-containing protein [Christensenellaceae bacterium OttesenSCG-928-M15]
MKLVKCENGHFYDEERFDTCPHCDAPLARNDNMTVPVARTPANDAVTMALDATALTGSVAPQGGGGAASAASQNSALQDAVKAASAGSVNAPISGDKTVGFFKSKIGTEPVVGWVVCVAGEHFGEDFKLKSGRNFIGRSADMDVSIAKDSTVSRDKHAVIVYEPRGNVFILQPGDSKELCYLNDDVVLTPKELKVHDRLLIGKTELMFVPCCTKEFNWDMVKAPNAEE